MPSLSSSQMRAMRAAAEGKSTLGIPKSVGQEFAKADEAQDTPSPFPEHVQAQQGFKRFSKTHRGRRSLRQSPPSTASPTDHHAVAKGALAKAAAASSPQASLKHLFHALSSLKKA